MVLLLLLPINIENIITAYITCNYGKIKHEDDFFLMYVTTLLYEI